MRVIQIGAGGFGRSWAELAAAAAGIELVGVADPSPGARTWAIDTLGLPAAAVFPDPGAAFAAVDAEAALVVTPPETHRAVAIAALEAGKHVLLEKPLATTLGDAREMVAAAGAAGRVLMVSQNYRFRPPTEAARRAVRDGSLGDLAAVRIRFLRDTRELWPADNFRYAMRHPLVLDMTIHHADLLRAVTGQEVRSLYAQGWRVPDSPYLHDPAVAATMTLEGGATVLYEGDWATRDAETSWNGDWELIGERGRLRWSGGERDALTGDLTFWPTGGEPSRLALPEMAATDRAASLARFRRAIETGEAPETAAADNIRSLAIVLACVESIESGEVVVPASG